MASLSIEAPWFLFEMSFIICIILMVFKPSYSEELRKTGTWKNKKRDIKMAKSNGRKIKKGQ